MKVKSLSRVQLFATPWSAAYQAPSSVGFSRQEYWSGVPLPSPMCVYVCVCVCVCIYIYICVCVYIYIYIYMGGGVELLNEIAFLTFLSQFPVAMFLCVFVQNTLTLKFISITIFTGEMRV